MTGPVGLSFVPEVPAPVLAFAPIFLAFIAFAIGFVLIALMGRVPQPKEKAAEGDAAAPAGALARAALEPLERSLDEKAALLQKLGLVDIEHIADDPTPDADTFRCRNPMPMVGGTYFVHFVRAEAYDGAPVPSGRIESFRKVVKHEEGVIKGILATTGAFSKEAWEAAAGMGQIELIDGRNLLRLLEMFYPERFPPARV